MRSDHFNATHGESHGAHRTPEYAAWLKMKARCGDSNGNRFHIYGGRGITVCDRWLNSYSNFLADVGRRPSPIHSLDRIQVNGSYEPGNVRWATAKEQSNNQRKNLLVTIQGVTHTLKEWCSIMGISYMMVYLRVRRRGWNPELALKTPRMRPLKIETVGELASQ